jgi:hypothetical protein
MGFDCAARALATPLVASLKHQPQRVGRRLVRQNVPGSRIGEDQIFFLRSRGLKSEDAVNLIVNGFCKEVMQQLPMEFAIEAAKLINISLEGSVG